MNDQKHDDPVVRLLLLLEHGRRTGDFELITRAKRELERLRVHVLAISRDETIPND